MNKEALEKRLADLQQGATLLQQQIEQFEKLMQQRQADLQATHGAIQECQHWLVQLDPPEKLSDP